MTLVANKLTDLSAIDAKCANNSYYRKTYSKMFFEKPSQSSMSSDVINENV